MSSRYRRLLQLIAGAAFAAFGMSMTSSQLPCVSMPGQASTASDSAKTLIWQSAARLHHGLRTVRGTLIFDSNGVEFRSEQRFSHRWPFIEIQSFDLTPHHFVLISYENRGRHLPGDRRFRFDLSQAITSSVAAELTQRVAKPVRNGEPDPGAPSVATIPARHTTRTGGSNGVLHFRDTGIDYVTSSAGDGRSWRSAHRTRNTKEVRHETCLASRTCA